MVKLAQTGERSIISEINSRYLGNRSLNDCALIDNGDEYILLSTDLASEYTNIPEGADPKLIGEFTAAINLSDIAAMAGIPVGMAVSLSINPETEEEYLYRIMDGINRKLRKYDAEILGGDTKEGPGLSITGTVIGKQKKDKILLRSALKKGQVLCVTGSLGRAASGYVFLKTGYNRTAGIQMIMNIEPRIREAQIIAEYGARFMTDLSDGLFSSLHQIKTDLGIGSKIVLDELSTDRNVKKASEISGASTLELTYGFGGDYELLFSIDNSRYSEFRDAMKKENIPVSYVGETWEGENIIFNGENWENMESKGYEHFRKIPPLGSIR